MESASRIEGSELFSEDVLEIAQGSWEAAAGECQQGNVWSPKSLPTGLGTPAYASGNTAGTRQAWDGIG